MDNVSDVEILDTRIVLCKVLHLQRKNYVALCKLVSISFENLSINSLLCSFEDSLSKGLGKASSSREVNILGTVLCSSQPVKYQIKMN